MKHCLLRGCGPSNGPTPSLGVSENFGVSVEGVRRGVGGSRLAHGSPCSPPDASCGRQDQTVGTDSGDCPSQAPATPEREAASCFNLRHQNALQRRSDREKERIFGISEERETCGVTSIHGEVWGSLDCRAFVPQPSETIHIYQPQTLGKTDPLLGNATYNHKGPIVKFLSYFIECGRYSRLYFYHGRTPSGGAIPSSASSSRQGGKGNKKTQSSCWCRHISQDKTPRNKKTKDEEQANPDSHPPF